MPAPAGTVDGGWATAVREAFETRHEREYFGRFSDLGVHLVTVRVTGVGRMPTLHWPTLPSATQPSRAILHEHPVVFSIDGRTQSVATLVFERSLLAAGDELAGPAIIEQPDSTTVVPPGAHARIDQIGNIVLEVGR